MKTISKNVLLLAFDDDEDQLEVFDFLFKEMGVQEYVLCFTKDDFFARLTPGLNFCIIDHRLHDTTGIEVTKEVKRRNKGNYVMIYSGIRDFDVVVEYLNNGADRFVKKSPDLHNPEFMESIRIGFIEAQERIIEAKNRADYEAAKATRLTEHTENLINLIDRGTT